MAKKKDKLQVLNNIQELNLEIDYDKLAEAIVKANTQVVEEANKSKKDRMMYNVLQQTTKGLLIN